MKKTHRSTLPLTNERVLAKAFIVFVICLTLAGAGLTGCSSSSPEP